MGESRFRTGEANGPFTQGGEGAPELRRGATGLEDAEDGSPAHHSDETITPNHQTCLKTQAASRGLGRLAAARPAAVLKNALPTDSTMGVSIKGRYESGSSTAWFGGIDETKPSSREASWRSTIQAFSFPHGARPNGIRRVYCNGTTTMIPVLKC